MGAGESAAEQARKKREQAERLLRDAEKWERGAEGERRVAALLDQLPAGYAVFHDLQLPAPSRANVDHLVVGTLGVWAVDAKFYSHAVTRGRGRGADTLWSGGKPLRRTLQACAWEAERVAELIGEPVRPMMCVIAPSIPAASFDFGGVAICSPAQVVRELTTRASSEVDVDAVAGRVAAVFAVAPSKRSAPTLTAPASNSSSSFSPSSPLRSPPVPAWRRANRIAVRLIESPFVRLAALAAAAFVGLALLPTFAGWAGSLGQRASESMLDRVTPTTTETTVRSTDSAPTTAVERQAPPVASTGSASTTVVVRPPPPVDYVVTCAMSGAGWIVSWVWPGELPAGVAGYVIKTRRSDGVVLSHSPVLWDDPLIAPPSIRTSDSDFHVITELVDAERRVVASSEERFRAPDSTC